MKKDKQLHLGAAYYPEHWPEERWAEDIALMKAAGFTVVRMGEFAWSRFEPEEGRFVFDWMDRAIALLAEAGIQTVLGTPTAAPPAWMVQQYPEILRVGEDGRKVQFGNRCHYCVSSPKYHEFTRRMVEAMGQHYAENPHVIGWQLDNEFSQECHCDHCRADFQAYLKEQFGTLEELNARWTTDYWSQTYSAWEQIELPRAGHNPGLMMAYRQYFTAAYRRYAHLQVECLRKYIPAEHWITHNYMGWFGRFDHYELSRELDLVSDDYYVGSGHVDPASSAAVWDLMRGLKQQNFWLMETQPGSVNWAPVSNKLNKGEARTLAWQAIAHGCDAVLYWQWRSALNGQEQYHGSLLDQAGLPRPFYEEAAELGDDLAALSAVLAGTQVENTPVAILNDYESRWSLEHQRHHKDFDYVTELNRWYKPFYDRNIRVDIVSIEAELRAYRIVVVPHMVVLDEERAQKLSTYVEKGGTVIITCRTGVKDHFDAMLPTRPPGPILQEVTGVEVEEYYALDRTVPVTATLFRGSAQYWAEKLKTITSGRMVETARFEDFNGWIDGRPAVTTHMPGRGIAYYVGCVLDDVSMRKLVDHILLFKMVKPVLKDVPPGVEVCTRVNAAGEKFLILINHTQDTRKVKFPPGMHEYITDGDYEGEVNLPPYSVAVLGKRQSEEAHSVVAPSIPQEQ